MIFLQIVLMLCIAAIFMFVPPWMLGFSPCRMSASWTDEDKVEKYIIIDSPWLAKLLIGQYFGFNSHIRTNLPFLYNRFYVNRYPNRLSRLGLIDYLVTGPLSIGWVCVMFGYFFFERYDNSLIPVFILLLMLHAVIDFILIAWNCGRRKEEEPILKAELKRLKRLKRSRRTRE